jgi:diadenosine tetraphosphate (Ap4A) HIT family hydrolase
MSSCPFCSINKSRILLEEQNVYAIYDQFPVSPGHALIIPKRHISRFHDLDETEKMSIVHLLDKTQQLIDENYGPAGYNFGINDGAIAGQTVPHLHLHIIPRYAGDVADPRGGVRWVIPNKAKYWN